MTAQPQAGLQAHHGFGMPLVVLFQPFSHQRRTLCRWCLLGCPSAGAHHNAQPCIQQLSSLRKRILLQSKSFSASCIQCRAAMLQQRNITTSAARSASAPVGLARSNLARSKTALTRCRLANEQPPLDGQQDRLHKSPQIIAADAAASVSKVPAAVARSILARRSVVDDEALHRPVGLVAFGAYVLGSAASLVGECRAGSLHRSCHLLLASAAFTCPLVALISLQQQA